MIRRPPIICPHCGHENHFIINPMTEWQRLTGWCGDNGGHYPDTCSSCEKSLLKIEGIEKVDIDWNEILPGIKKDK